MYYGSLTLAEMVEDLKHEVGHSTTASHGANMEGTLKYYLKRTQRELYVAYDWPQFMVDEQIPFSEGDRYLTDPTKFSYEQINKMWCRQGSEWYAMFYGIDPELYSLYNPDNDVRGFPIQRWKPDASQGATGAIEIWPIASIDGSVLVRGQIDLPALVDDGDTSLLDGQMVVLFAAANMLARDRNEDAGLVLTKAQQYLTALQKNMGSQKRAMVSLSRADGGRRPRAGLDYIPRR